jgi:zinc/manganese transport system permease protein
LLAFCRPLVFECCDPWFLRAESRISAAMHYLLLVLVVLNLVAGFHAIGTLMAVGMMILPAAAARFWSQALDTIIVVAVLLSLLGSYAGLLFSFYMDAPSSACIILCLGVLYLLSCLFGTAQGQWQRWFPPHHLEA